eukprot:2127908-Prymnesium_polylepis.1
MTRCGNGRRTARTAARRGSATGEGSTPPGCAVPTRGTRAEAPPMGYVKSAPTISQHGGAAAARRRRSRDRLHGS